jgi:hypothetical protein
MTGACQLEQATGQAGSCPERACAFWEPGGAVLPGRCAFDRLDLSGRPEVAAELLRIRALLESSCSASEEQDLRHLSHHLLNESGED